MSDCEGVGDLVGKIMKEQEEKSRKYDQLLAVLRKDKQMTAKSSAQGYLVRCYLEIIGEE